MLKKKLNTIAGFHAADADVITRIVTDESDATVLKPYHDNRGHHSLKSMMVLKNFPHLFGLGSFSY